jgi:hypothetical protein
VKERASYSFSVTLCNHLGLQPKITPWPARDDEHFASPESNMDKKSQAFARGKLSSLGMALI